MSKILWIFLSIAFQWVSVTASSLSPSAKTWTHDWPHLALQFHYFWFLTSHIQYTLLLLTLHVYMLFLLTLHMLFIFASSIWSSRGFICLPPSSQLMHHSFLLLITFNRLSNFTEPGISSWSSQWWNRITNPSSCEALRKFAFSLLLAVFVSIPINS